MRLAACVLLLAGCSPEPREACWSVTLPPLDAAEAWMVEVRIHEGGCEGPVVHREEVYRGEVARAPDRPLPPGRYGFVARARDGRCRWFAEQCVIADAPLSAPACLEITPAPIEPEPACEAGRCDERGRCAGEDAGPGDDAGRVDGGRTDAGPGEDAGRDGGRVDAGAVDAGAPDAGTGVTCGDGVCGEGELCIAGSCIATCNVFGADEACGRDRLCYQGMCMPRCFGVGGCPASFSCLKILCWPTCAGSGAACPEDLVCVEDAFCWPACPMGTPCPAAAPECVRGSGLGGAFCSTACRGDEDCPRGARCGTEADGFGAIGQCVFPCMTDADCAGVPGAGTCLGARCWPPFI